jgi:membrane-bound lytic murein transglycosylase A
VPVTPLATIATDKDVYPWAMPAFVSTRVPSVAVAAAGGATGGAATGGAAGGGSLEPVPYRGFLLDQDAGGAIRAAGRADLYMGIGPQAEQAAGHQVYPGELYYLAIKPDLVPQYLGTGPVAGPAR